MEERRTHVTVEFKQRRLGMYLEPVDDENRGALLVKFEQVDGMPGEAETSKVLRPGFRIAAINDVNLSYAQFPTIIAALINSARPVRISFRDPDVHEFRDRYGFLRTKLHVDRETAAGDASRTATERNDRAWLTFLTELGGVKGRGPAAGVARLLRDANGEVSFPLEPSVRLNAVSPLHPRMEGISSGDPRESKKGKKGAGASGKAAAGASSNSSSASTSGGAVRRISKEASASSISSTGSAASAVVVSIYKRCWSTASIGIVSPPGLAVPLPGDLPKGPMRAQLLATLQRLVLQGGVPVAYRPIVWWELSGGHAKAALHPPGYYQSLLATPPTAEAAYAISKDLDRTFPGHAFFESKAGVASLQRLLSAFSVHNPDIGYCQSLNFVAGFLLLLLPEEQAFWVLECLVNEILPPEYYTTGLTGVHVDQRVLAHLVDEMFPDVSEALQRAGVALQVVTVEWFMCALCTTLPAGTALRLWDALFAVGAEALFRVGLTLFHQNRSRLLSVAASSTTSSVTVKVVQPAAPTGTTPPPAGTAVAISNSSGGSARPSAASVSSPEGAAGGAGGGRESFAFSDKDLERSWASSRNLNESGEGNGNSVSGSSGGSPPPDPSAGGASGASGVISRMASMRAAGASSGSSGRSSPLGPSTPVAGAAASSSSMPAAGPTFIVHHSDNPNVGAARPPRRSLFSPRDTIAETAAKVLAALPAAISSSNSGEDGSSGSGGGGGGWDSSEAPQLRRVPSVGSGGEMDGGGDDVSGSDSAATGSPAPSLPSPPVARGGTVRHPMSTFPALFAMVKGMPSTAHDADALMATAYPLTPKEQKAVGLAWEFVSRERLARLRSAARAQVQAEQEQVAGMRAARGLAAKFEAEVEAEAAAAAAAAAAAEEQSAAVSASASSISGVDRPDFSSADGVLRSEPRPATLVAVDDSAPLTSLMAVDDSALVTSLVSESEAAAAGVSSGGSGAPASSADEEPTDSNSNRLEADQALEPRYSGSNNSNSSSSSEGPGPADASSSSDAPVAVDQPVEVTTATDGAEAGAASSGNDNNSNSSSSGDEMPVSLAPPDRRVTRMDSEGGPAGEVVI